jgi:uncharacterized peroxidase-related enzyme
MPRIAWIEDAAARGELADLYGEVKAISPTGEVDDVIRCLSLRPDFLAPIVQAARLHFADGTLTQAQHEMIASYVSALNRCESCLSAHTRFLQLHGEQYHQTAQALREGDLETAGLSTAERLLLEFVGTLTRHAHRITDEQVQGLRDAGWTDAQIAEAVYDAALLNFFNRIADAFDIRPPVAPGPIDPPRHER